MKTKTQKKRILEQVQRVNQISLFGTLRAYPFFFFFCWQCQPVPVRFLLFWCRFSRFFTQNQPLIHCELDTFFFQKHVIHPMGWIQTFRLLSVENRFAMRTGGEAGTLKPIWRDLGKKKTQLFEGIRCSSYMAPRISAQSDRRQSLILTRSSIRDSVKKMQSTLTTSNRRGWSTCRVGDHFSLAN